MKRIYLDYAATTPVDPAVLRAMQPYFSAKFGNPGSLHSFGQEAIAAVDQSRETIARAIGAEFREIIFTSSATEANNLALRGAIRAALKKDEKNGVAKDSGRPRIIISAIEHESILETARELEREGVEIIYVPVNRSGFVDPTDIKSSLNERTVLVSVMYANNEIGSIQPIAEIGKSIKEFRSQLPGTGNRLPIFHTDAAQALQFLDCDIQTLGVDMMTISSHKIYGPKGAAALYAKNGDALAPLVFGGGQEFGVRSGTENVPAIVGFAKAVELADAARKKESDRIAALRNDLWRDIKKIFPKAEINGGDEVIKNQTQFFLPNILNVYFPEHAAQDLLTRFDLAGLAVSSGSACRSRAFESSYVIEALGYSKERAKSSIRFSLGRPTTAGDVAKTLDLTRSIFHV
jgi:cysteine desulfurase